MVRHRASILCLMSVVLLAGEQPAHSQSANYPAPQEVGLQTLNNPGGGQVLYGTLHKDSALPAAMVTMLRTVHGYFGARPAVAQFFQAKGSDSVAAFFTVDAHTRAGLKKISGLVIVSLQAGGAPTGIAMFDDAAHFAKTQPVMLKAANEALRKEAAANAPVDARTTPAASGPRGAAEPLHMATGGDRSATVGLPDGWQLTSVRGGQLTAAGPHDEMMGLGLLIGQIHDPRAGGPARTYNGQQAVVAPCGGDIFSAYTSVMNQTRQRNNLPAGSWTKISSTPLNAQTIEAMFEVDFHDGKGMRRGSAQVGEMMCGGRSPAWAMTIAQAFVPVAVWEQERATITAMYKSYSQDESVIRGETQKKIDDIHAIGARAKQQAADADARRVASSQSFNQHMDNIDRQSKAFQNYQFDSQQLQMVGDDGNIYRGTVSNNAASALIQADPNRFLTVPTASFIKGVDY